jgi:hypothetical protein
MTRQVQEKRRQAAAPHGWEPSWSWAVQEHEARRASVPGALYSVSIHQVRVLPPGLLQIPPRMETLA